MSIATDAGQRARWLARVARVENELTDLQREIDIAFRGKVAFRSMQRLVNADVHLDRAKMELNEAASEVTAL